MSVLCRLSFYCILRRQQSTFLSSGSFSRNLQTKSKNRATSFALNKYVSFVKSYEEILKKKFPRAVKFYQVFSVGLKYFKNDVLILFRAFKKATSSGLSTLTRKELELFYQMPRDILRTAPVLFIGGVVPGGGIIFIVAHYFPRTLLTHHFWSLQQKSQFALLEHKKKLQNYKPVFRCVQKNLDTINDDILYKPMRQVLECLGSGTHPTPEVIMSCKPLFEKSPYSLSCLSRNHVVGLLKIHDMHKGWRRKQRLHDRAHIIHLMDLAIIREGGAEALSFEDIKWCCFFRGLNPVNMRNDQILIWLRTWLTISQQLDESCYSLLLHCPILLGYNQPSNWSLLHDNR